MEGMHELVSTKQTTLSIKVIQGVIGSDLYSSKENLVLGSHIPNTVTDHLYLNLFPFTCKDITFHYLKNIDLPLKSGRLDFGHKKSLRKRREKVCVSPCA